MTFAPRFSEGNFTSEQVNLPDDISQLKQYLKTTLEEHARFINRKELANYELIEQQNCQTYFNPNLLPGTNPSTRSYVYRKTINFGALPNAGVITIPHGITGINNQWRFVNKYADASDLIALRFIRIPDANSTLVVDATNVIITTTVNLSMYTQCYVNLEFVKN